jgi:hypothetical protein
MHARDGGLANQNVSVFSYETSRFILYENFGVIIKLLKRVHVIKVHSLYYISVARLRMYADNLLTFNNLSINIDIPEPANSLVDWPDHNDL